MTQNNSHLCDGQFCDCRLFTADHTHVEHHLEAARAFAQAQRGDTE